MRIFYLLLVIALALGSNQIGAQNLVDKGKIMQLSIGLRTNTVQPLFDLKNNRLYFVSIDVSIGDSSSTDQNIYYVERTKNGWSSPQSSGLEQINDRYNNGVVGISSSGDTLYLLGNYNGKGEKRKGLSMAIRSKEGQFKLIEETIKIQKFNPFGTFYGIYMHPKGEHLFISMSSRGDYGVENLYYSKKVDDFNYGEPKKIDALNTDELEFAPFITNDLETLYFTRSDSTGNFSVYSSNRMPGDDSFLNWSTPASVKNVNTADFEGFFSIYNEEFFFVSDRDTTFTTIYSNASQVLPDSDEWLAANDSDIDTSNISVRAETVGTKEASDATQLAEMNAGETTPSTVSNSDDENGFNNAQNQPVNLSPEETVVGVTIGTLAAKDSHIGSTGDSGSAEAVGTNEASDATQLAEMNAGETSPSSVTDSDDEKRLNNAQNQPVHLSPEETAVGVTGEALAANGEEEEHKAKDTGKNENPEVVLAANDMNSNVQIEQERNISESNSQSAHQIEGSESKTVTRKYVIDHFEFNVVYAPEQELLRVLDSLNLFSELKSISIVGHTDFISSDEINIKIGNQRAKTTRWWLTRYGRFDPLLCTVRSAGEFEPVRSGEGEAVRAYNRRVEITVTGYLK